MEEKYEIQINEIMHYARATTIRWAAKGVGFGELSIVFDNSNQEFYIDGEYMDDNFIKQVLAKANEYIMEGMVRTDV